MSNISWNRIRGILTGEVFNNGLAALVEVTNKTGREASFTVRHYPGIKPFVYSDEITVGNEDGVDGQLQIDIDRALFKEFQNEHGTVPNIDSEEYVKFMLSFDRWKEETEKISYIDYKLYDIIHFQDFPNHDKDWCKISHFFS